MHILLNVSKLLIGNVYLFYLLQANVKWQLLRLIGTDFVPFIFHHPKIYRSTDLPSPVDGSMTLPLKDATLLQVISIIQHLHCVRHCVNDQDTA